MFPQKTWDWPAIAALVGALAWTLASFAALEPADVIGQRNRVRLLRRRRCPSRPSAPCRLTVTPWRLGQ